MNGRDSCKGINLMKVRLRGEVYPKWFWVGLCIRKEINVIISVV